MTPLQILAAKVRGADDNERGAEIIARWYAEQTKHAVKLAGENAGIVRESKAFETDSLREQLAKSFDSIADLLTLGGGQDWNNDNDSKS